MPDDNLERRAKIASELAGTLQREARRLSELSARMRAARHGEVAIVRCAWCERFEIDGDWLHLEEIGSGRQHVRKDLEKTATHGICPECLAAVGVPTRDA